MASEGVDTVSVAVMNAEAEKVDLVVGEIPFAKDKATKEKRGKGPSKEKKARVPVTRPPYREMIAEAISALKERTGSSQQAIGKFIEEKYKSELSQNFKKILSVQLRNLTKAEKLTRVKNSYKLSESLKKATRVVKSHDAEAAPKVKAAVKAKKTKTKTKKVKTAKVSEMAKVAKATKSPKGGKKIGTPRKVAKSIKTTKLRTPKSVASKV